MSKVENLAESKNFKAINIGKFEDIKNFSFGEFKSRVFLKDLINSTGSEISINSIPANMELPFFHAHKQNEEIYIFLKGEGKFQVDDDVFPVQDGSIIRVSPEGKRSLKNTLDTDLIWICIQVKANSLEQYTVNDGIVVKENISKL